MQKYIGCKVIEAEPCKAWKDAGEHKVGDEGYKLVYPDGYVSWSPKETFEATYVPTLPDFSVTQKECQQLMKSFVALMTLASVTAE